MLSDSGQLSVDIDISAPSVARVYDYLLGGAHNFAVDRELAAKAMAIDPLFQVTARATRSALRRMVRFMVDSGIRQFLDIGSGIPTAANVHETAQRLDPSCRVVYVDRDPLAVVHSRQLLEGNARVATVHADMRNPDDILRSPEVTSLLNLDEPIGLLFLLVLHWIPDHDDPQALMDHFRRAVPSGSHLAITHVGHSYDRAVDAMLRESGSGEMTPRTEEQVATMFGDFDLVSPGLVSCTEWRPDGPSDSTPLNRTRLFAGLGIKP
ncbi:hypothetical protein D5S17_18410 [Pseudonocardiaceae bacterium YIM PH 21723]|nr:hypothetical protein D5S17_18410 [Pseudonocardiaceae bacterium YIM PH 21723]